MTATLPDPLAAALAEAERIGANRQQYLQGPYKRVCADAPWADPAALIDGIEAFHRERMSKVPSHARYPEARPWVEHIVARERELQRLTGMSDLEMALYRSLNDFLSYRGYRQAAAVWRRAAEARQAALTPAVQVEKCRVAYLPRTDRGQLHIKNVDDPPTYWRCRAGRPESLGSERWQHLKFDGVGSGLHLDHEPEDTFPLPGQAICAQHCDDVPGAIEFLTRYKPFYGGGNFVMHDGQQRSAAVEHCSRNFIEVFEPGSDGRSWCSGMVCRDPGSPQGRHQRAMREEYLRLTGMANNPMDTADVAFWNACDAAERILAEYLRQPQASQADHVFAFFLTPFPNGLNKAGVLYHPQAPVREYTLVTHGTLIDERTYIRYQRSDPPELAMATEPEVFTF